jgi:AcrR family transcriptional regulator
MTDQKRVYTKRLRAEQEGQTRQRIVESAVALHGSLGPSRTSFSAIADHAGVRRSTLYRHFPDEAAMFTACSEHWAQQNPPPDLAAWASVDDPDERLERALEELYAFYARNEQMLGNVSRDAQLMPVVAERFSAFVAYIAAAIDVLMAGRRLRGAARTRVRAAIGHALALSTWRSLVREQELTASQSAALMVRLASAASAGATG